MAKIAVLITDLFEDSEYTQPAKAFSEAGHQLVIVGVKEPQEVVRGKKENTPVTIDKNIKEAKPDDFDALLIPGGYSPDKLRAEKEAIDFTRGFAEAGKPILSICHGPQLLISAEALKGRRATGWKSIAQDIKNAGAEYLDQEVVEDGNLITSRHPGDLPAFVEVSLNKLNDL